MVVSLPILTTGGSLSVLVGKRKTSPKLPSPTCKTKVYSHGQKTWSSNSYEIAIVTVSRFLAMTVVVRRGKVCRRPTIKNLWQKIKIRLLRAYLESLWKSCWFIHGFEWNNFFVRTSGQNLFNVSEVIFFLILNVIYSGLFLLGNVFVCDFYFGFGRRRRRFFDVKWWIWVSLYKRISNGVSHGGRRGLQFFIFWDGKRCKFCRMAGLTTETAQKIGKSAENEPRTTFLLLTGL